MNDIPQAFSSASQMEQIGARFVNWIITRPLLALVAGLILVGCAMSGFPHIKANFTHTAFFRPSDPMLQEFDKFERQFGNDDAVAVVISCKTPISHCWIDVCQDW